MREMTDEQIIEALATNRMYWHRGDFKNGESHLFWYGKDSKRTGFCISNIMWNPLKNILDAFQLVEEMKKGEWLLTLEDKGDKWKAVFMDPEACFLAEADTPQRAISLAILDYVA